MDNDHGVSVRAIIIQNNRLLVEWWEPDKVCFPPGGRIQGAESFEQALKRELFEELATDQIQPGRYLGKVLSIWQAGESRNRSLSHYYSCCWPQANTRLKPRAGEAGREFRWILLSDLRKNRLVPPLLCDLVPTLQDPALNTEWNFTVHDNF